MNPYGQTQRHLLLVEDSPEDADFIIALLEDEQGPRTQFTQVETLADSAAQLGSSHFDAVLLDLRLPDGEGVECVEAALRPRLPSWC